MEILVFCLGLIFFYSKSVLALIVGIILFLLEGRSLIFLPFIAGSLLGYCHEFLVADQGMPNQAVIRKALVKGALIAVPKVAEGKTLWVLGLSELNGQIVRASVLISCYQDCPMLKAGQNLSFYAKLRQPHRLNNPGSEDHKHFLQAQHIHWQGYRLPGPIQAQALSQRHFSVLALREYLAQRSAKMIHQEQTLGIVEALTLGLSHHMSQDLWDLFRHTGTTHLMVISGAHIGLISGLIFQMIRQIWARIPYLCLRYPAPKVAGLCAMISGFAYACLAGLGIPALRSAFASMFMFYRYWGSQLFSAWQAWRYALVIVLLTEPHAVLMPGFYLSFLAVAILLMVNQATALQGFAKGLLIQFSCLLGLLPLTLYFFGYGALDGFFANIVAIPWVSFLVLPLSLLSLFLGPILPWLLVLTELSIHWLLEFLKFVDVLGSTWNLSQSLPYLIYPLVAMLALIIFLLFPLKRIRFIAIAMLLLSCYPRHHHLSKGELSVSVLDVGQGLAVFIQTQAHDLIYDTGGKIYHGPDMGTLVLNPYLKSLGLRHLDAIIISHPDLDHRGGLESLEQKFPSKTLLVDDPGFYHRGVSCHDYPDWIWDGVRFHFFALAKTENRRNNRSCVLKISNSAGSVLLTGDIEAEAEHYLSEHYGQALQANVMVVPHHGSKTSSSLEFIKQVSPSHAILSYGFDNRYHFPHQAALKHYQSQGIQLFSTAEQGLIQIDLSNKGIQLKPFLTK